MSRVAVATPVVLGMVEVGYTSGYAIAAAVARSTTGFWPAAQNAIYPELRRLVAAGQLRTSSEAVGGRRRDHHELTAEGRAVLDRWRADTGELRIEHRDEGLLMLHFGDQLTVAQVRDILESACGQRRDRLDELEAVRPDPENDRPGAYVSWRTGLASLRHALAWYAQLLDAIRDEPADALALPLLAAVLSELPE